MKTTKIRPCSLLAVLILFCSLTGWAEKAESIKKKEYNKSFNVSLSDLLQVDNRYGNITITHWSKNEVSIQVVVEAKARNSERAQASIDRVKIDLNKSGNVISAITSLKEQNWSGGNNERLTINYYINIPSKLSIDLSQKYGNINLPEKNEGKSILHAKYGNINGGSFTAQLDLESAYGNVELGSVENAVLDLAYCGHVSLKNAGTLTIDSKYSNLNLGDVKKLNLEKKYGNIQIQQVGKATMEIKYSKASIDVLTQELIADELDYSTLSVSDVASGFSRIAVSARYGKLNLDLPEKASFTVVANSIKYGSYDINGFNVTRSNVENKTNYRSEVNGGGGGRIEFEGNNYSNLRINRK